MGTQVFNIPRVAAASQPLVFQEQFTGNAVDTTFQLTGAVLNATFQIGAWDTSDLIITHLGDITNTSGKPLYDSAIPFTRHRISIVSVNSSGLVTLDYPPRAEDFYIYYWYQPKASDRLSDYIRDDIVSRVEETVPDIASSIEVDTSAFGGTLSVADNTVQKALDTLDDLTADDVGAVSISDWDTNGVFDIAETTISFVDGTRTFSITPVGANFSYFIAGQKYTKNTAQTLSIEDTEGQHIIYFSGTSLVVSVNPTAAQIRTIFLDYAIVAIVYWDADNNIGELYDERHGYKMSAITHVYLHTVFGVQWDIGLAVGDVLADESGDLDSHAQFSITAGIIRDEDLVISTNAKTSTTGLEIWYRGIAANSWRKNTVAGFSVLNSGTAADRLVWDNAGTLTEVTEGDFVLCHVFSWNSADGNPIAIVGQAEYNTLALARAGADAEIQSIVLTGLPVPEMKPIATIIFQTDADYNNAVHARIRSTESGDDYIDWRSNPLNGVAPASDHGNLSGLGDDDHLQYLNATRHTAIGDAAPHHARQHSITSLDDHTFPGGGTTFLRDDGTFQAVGGGHAAVTLDANADTLLSLSTQELGLDTQTANKVFSGPTTGAAAVPTFRVLAAADLPLRYKIGTTTHDLSVTGTQAITGVGFTPSLVLFFVCGANLSSLGIDDGSSSTTMFTQYMPNTSATVSTSGTARAISMRSVESSGNYASASITSFDSDGFTLTWAKVGAPTITVSVAYIAFK